MKFYDCKTAPSPRRVRIFLAEKRIEVATVQVDLRNREQLGAPYRALNPNCTVPMLELDDGTCIAESVAICRYFEEIRPEPPLMGVDPKDKALVEMWQRRVEIEGFLALADGFRNATPGLRGRALPGPVDYPQIPELAARGRARIAHFFDVLEERLGEAEFIAGARYTICDITALVTVDFAGWIKLAIPDGHANLKRWHAAVSARPSAKA